VKRLVSVFTTTAGGAVLYWIPPLAWGIAASCLLVTATGCTLIICGFFGTDKERRDWTIKVIRALRKRS
jgi:hypothetical protein